MRKETVRLPEPTRMRRKRNLEVKGEKKEGRGKKEEREMKKDLRDVGVSVALLGSEVGFAFSFLLC